MYQKIKINLFSSFNFSDYGNFYGYRKLCVIVDVDNDDEVDNNGVDDGDDEDGGSAQNGFYWTPF